MNIAAIEIRHLRYFVAVVEQRGLRGAALHLHVSQPPLTRQIQQLEQLLGVQLLVRKPRGVEPTAAGQVFYQEARNILMLAEQAVSRTQRAGHGQLGRLDVGIFGSAVFGVIPRILGAFRDRYPDVEVVLHNMDRAEQITALRERRLTVGFNRFFREEPDLHWEVIQREDMNVAVHESHPLARQRSVSLTQICKESLILYPRSPRPGFIDHMLGVFHKRGASPLHVQEVDELGTAVALASSGFGITLVSDSACNLRLPGLVYVPLRPSDRATIELCMIHRANDDSALLRAFLRMARSARISISKKNPPQ